MILTCPNCATRYVVGDDAVTAAGRTVRCASCGERWRATPGEDAPLELAAAPAAAMSQAAPAGAGFGKAGAEAPVSKAFRQQVQERRRTRQALGAGVVFAVASALVVLLVLALVLFPVAVVRVFPRMAGVYAAFKHPVNPTGLALEAQGEPGLIAGRPVLVVHGVERNVEARPRPATPLRVSLYDKGGRAVAVHVVRLDPAPIAPGDVRAFHAVFTDPPLSAVEFGVELAFDLPAMRAAPAGAPHRAFDARPAAVAVPRAGPVSEARPLPAGSPYALPASPPPARMAEVLIDATEVARRVEALADELAAWVDDETVVVCLLTGGIWFAADLTRALARRGRNPLFDCLWLASYGDAETSSGRVVERAGLQRPVAGRRVLVVDEVIDSGLSLLAARRICEKAGATEVRLAVFAEKPWPHPRDVAPDHVAWQAPARFLVGYGMDTAGRMRGLPGITALD